MQKPAERTGRTFDIPDWIDDDTRQHTKEVAGMMVRSGLTIDELEELSTMLVDVLDPNKDLHEAVKKCRAFVEQCRQGNGGAL